jgi:hypothetical protein
MVRDEKGRALVCGIDSMSDVSLVSPLCIDPDWPSTDVSTTIFGVGGESPVAKEVKTTIVVQWGASSIQVGLLVQDLPPGLDCLLGVDILDALETQIDRVSYRIFFGTLGIVAPMYTIQELCSRRAMRPMRVLAACAGGSFAYGAIYNMGYAIEKWSSIEDNLVCRDIASSIIHPDILHHVTPYNINSINEDHPIHLERFDLYVDTCPCQPWSRLRKYPGGFCDYRAMALLSSMKLYTSLKKSNPAMRLIAENVQPDASLSADTGRMEHGWNAPAALINARNWGSGSSRPRVIFSNIANLSTIPLTKPAPAEWIIEKNHHISAAWIPCVVGSINTKNPPKKIHNTLGHSSRLTAVESEKAQGFPPGITDKSRHKLDYEQRLDLIGNALNFAFIYNIMQHYAPPGHDMLVSLQAIRQTGLNIARASVPDIDQFLTHEHLESFLAPMSFTECFKWVLARRNGWDPPAMHLELKKGYDQPRAKLKASYGIPDKLSNGTKKALAELVEKGYAQIVPFRNQFFISEGFVKDKGRNDADGDIVVRLLGDFRNLNEVLADIPHHWRDLVSDIADIGAAIPRGSKYYIKYDFSDAYFQVPLTKESRDLVVLRFGKDFYQFLGAAQGISVSALFYQPHINAILFQILGCHWQHWYAGYVDDYGAHAMTPLSIATRDKVFRCICKVFNKTLSTKDDTPEDDAAFIGPALPPNAKPDLVLGGLYITSKGVRINDEGFIGLQFALTSYPVKTKTDALHIIGVCNYTRTAFQWTDASSTRYSDLVGILQAAATSERLSWGAPQVEACSQLYDHITKRPLMYCSPETIIDDDHCVVIHTDASNSSIGFAIFRVNVANADTVTLEMLKDILISQLISVKSNRLKQGQLSWNTFETELLAIVRSVETWGPYITSATARFPYNGIPKVAIMGDSSTAISQWTSLHLPSNVTDVLAAKSRRFFSWADKVACTNYWPMVLKHIPGIDNHLAHTISHMGNLCAQRHAELHSSGNKISLPVTLHSYHNSLPSRPAPTDGSIIPPDHIVQHLTLTQTDVDELIRAYRADNAMFRKVPMKELYAAVTADNSIDIPPLAKERITPWIGTQFFSVQIPGTTGNLLYTPTSCQVLAWGDTQDPAVNLSRTLVLVVPPGAKVRLTSMDSIIADADQGDGSHYMDHHMQQDLLIATHDLKDHPSRANTAANIRQLAWWPRITDSIKYHIDSCSHCIPKRAQIQSNGASVLAARRFMVIQIDHKVLSKHQAELTSHPAILSICDAASRQTMFIPALSMSATVTAQLLFVHWFSTYGFPEVIRSDKGSGFASEVFAVFRALSGVREWDSSASDNPTHHSLIENKHKILTDIIEQAEERGDLNMQSLAMITARAQQVCNFDCKPQGISAFQRVTGQPPRTLTQAMLTSPTASEITMPADEGHSTINADFVANLMAAIRDANAWETIIRDEKSRGAILYRLGTTSKKASQSSDLREGDTVSFHGYAHTIVSFLASPPSGHAKCLICREGQDSDNHAFVAKFSDLYRMADPRPELNITSILDKSKPAIGSLVFYLSGTNLVHSGIVLAHDPATTTIEVHQCAQAPKQDKQFMPTYMYPDGSIRRHTKAPITTRNITAKPITNLIELSSVVARADISTAFFISNDAMSAIRAAGVTMDQSGPRPPPGDERAISMPALDEAPVQPKISMVVTRALTRNAFADDHNLKVARKVLHLSGNNPFGNREDVTQRLADHFAKQAAVTTVAAPTCTIPGCDRPPWPGHSFCGKTHAKLHARGGQSLQPQLGNPRTLDFNAAPQSQSQSSTAMDRLIFILLAAPAIVFYVSLLPIIMAIYNGMTITIGLPENTWS